MAEAPAIEIQHLAKAFSFGRIKALDDVNLTVDTGEIFALIGPNGAGKTTLMGCMLALLRPTKGQIRIFGKAPDHIDVRKSTGFLPERPSFENWMNPKEFLRFHQMLAGRSKDESAKQDILDALAIVELEHVANRKIAKFSRGMLQRLGLAQVLVGKPKICFLDEPTAGMDPPGMKLVQNILHRFRAERTTVVINSHHLDEIERSCTCFAFIRNGKIEKQESINNMSGKMLVARWPKGIIPQIDNLAKLLVDCNVTLADFNEESAKILLTKREDAPDVIERLVNSGIRLEEIFLDRNNLSDLFRPNASSAQQISSEPSPVEESMEDRGLL